MSATGPQDGPTPVFSSPTSTPGPNEFLPSDTSMNRFRNFYRMATGKMSTEGQKKYWNDADLRYEAIDCKRCESQRDWLLQYSPIVNFMKDNIRQLGGQLDKSNIRCRRCVLPSDGHAKALVGNAGGFDKEYGIKLCANWLNTRSQVEDVMAHEMVHAYDHMRFKVDWDAQDDLRHVACTEVSQS